MLKPKNETTTNMILILTVEKMFKISNKKSLLHVQISSETCKLWKPKPTFAEMNKSITLGGKLKFIQNNFIFAL